jgi:hypothetical protein
LRQKTRAVRLTLLLAAYFEEEKPCLKGRRRELISRSRLYPLFMESFVPDPYIFSVEIRMQQHHKKLSVSKDGKIVVTKFPFSPGVIV